MKLTLFSALALVAASMTTQGQVTLNTGEVFTFEFSSLPLVGPLSEPSLMPLGNYSIILNPTSVQPGDRIMLEMFENSMSEQAIGSSTGGSALMVACQVDDAWGDLQGAIRLTMLSGSATVDYITLRALTPSGGDPPLNYYELAFAPVPEPTAGTLLGITFAAGIVWRIRNRSRNQR